MKPTNLAAYVLAVVCMVSAITSLPSATEQQKKNTSKKKPQVHLISSLEGADLFQAYCSTCHGDRGKGDGPVAQFLEPKVTDLTTIARRNGGVFPSARVRRIIAGKEVIKAHGTREMPDWEPIFRQKEKGKDLGEIRLENLTAYVNSLQEK